MSSPRQKRRTRILPPAEANENTASLLARTLYVEFCNFIPSKHLLPHFMKILPLAVNTLLCVGALLSPAFLASCREASERQDQIRFGLFPNVTHVQGLVAGRFSRTREGMV